VLGVDIIKISYKKPVCETYFVADIHLRDPGLIRSVFSDKKEKGSPRLHPRSMAKKNDAVLLINGDFFTEEKNLKGIVMRNGKLKYNGKKEDTLAVMPDGALRIYSPNEITPEELQALGVKDTFSFGPTLIRDGAINPNLEKHRLFQKNPRTGVGMIEPGHYIFIAVDGRQPGYSVGFTLRQFAEIFQSYGCVQAYNMDGGQSTAICFMGEQLNIMRHGEVGYPQRLLPDALIIGKSDLVD
jgi:exopolysaccharide biosynthesis protein